MNLDFLGKSKQQEEELQKALKQLAVFASEADRERNTYLLLLSSIGEAVFVLDLEKRITIVNKSGERMVERTADKLIGKHIDEVFSLTHKDHSPIEEKEWDPLVEERKVTRFPSDTILVSKTGNEIPVALTASPIVDKNTDKLQGFILTFLDVRAERTLEEARVRFISTASHQLRTPMTSIRWYSEILADETMGRLNKEQKDLVKNIYTSINRLIDLLNLLLQVSRIEANRVKSEPIPTDIAAFTKEVTDSLLPQFQDREQTINITSDPNMPEVLLDKMIVWQVFQNLVTNAGQYSPNKTTIDINIHLTESEFICSVTDKGIGIPKKAQEHIFEKFFRAENAMTTRPSGSGIGLSLCKSLVEGWGGKIWFDSQEKKGTTFFFTIPRNGMKAKAGEVSIAI